MGLGACLCLRVQYCAGTFKPPRWGRRVAGCWGRALLQLEGSCVGASQGWLFCSLAPKGSCLLAQGCGCLVAVQGSCFCLFTLGLALASASCCVWEKEEPSWGKEENGAELHARSVLIPPAFCTLPFFFFPPSFFPPLLFFSLSSPLSSLPPSLPSVVGSVFWYFLPPPPPPSSCPAAATAPSSLLRGPTRVPPHPPPSVSWQRCEQHGEVQGAEGGTARGLGCPGQVRHTGYPPPPALAWLHPSQKPPPKEMPPKAFIPKITPKSQLPPQTHSFQSQPVSPAWAGCLIFSTACSCCGLGFGSGSCGVPPGGVPAPWGWVEASGRHVGGCGLSGGLRLFSPTGTSVWWSLFVRYFCQDGKETGGCLQ